MSDTFSLALLKWISRQSDKVFESVSFISTCGKVFFNSFTIDWLIISSTECQLDPKTGYNYFLVVYYCAGAELNIASYTQHIYLLF